MNLGGRRRGFALDCWNGGGSSRVAVAGRRNFNNDILRALFRVKCDLDIVRAQDVGLKGTDDETVLAWAADQNRVLLTHDVTTITAHAYRRIMKGDAMPGVFEVSRRISVRSAVEDITTLGVQQSG